MKRRTAGRAAVAISLLLAACGSDADDARDTTATAVATGEPVAPTTTQPPSTTAQSSSTMSTEAAPSSTSTTSPAVGVGLPLPVVDSDAAAELRPVPFAAISEPMAVAARNGGVVVLGTNQLELLDGSGIVTSTVPLAVPFDASGATMVAGPDGLLYVDHFVGGGPRRMLTAIDPVTGAVVAEAEIMSDHGGESEPFIAAGRVGIVDRISDTLVLAYPSGPQAVDAPAFLERPDHEGGTVVVVRGDQRWEVPIIPHPDAAMLYSGNPLPENAPAGSVVFSTWVGPDVSGGDGSDPGTPSGQVVVDLHADGSALWYRFPDEWRIVSTDDTGVLVARSTPGAPYELAWIFQLPSD